MTKTELLLKVEKGGGILAVAEYRAGVAETITYRDKTTGRQAEFKKVTYNVEVGTHAIQITERLDDNVNTEQWKSPFKKGDPVVWHVQGLEKDRMSGVYKGSGKLEDYKA